MLRLCAWYFEARFVTTKETTVKRFCVRVQDICKKGMESWFLKFGRHSKLQHFPRQWRLLSWCTTNEWAKLEGDLLGLTGFPSEKSLTETLGTPDTQYHVTKNVGSSNEKTWHLAAHESFIHAKWWNHSQLVSFAFCAVLGPNPNCGQFFSLPVIQLSSPQPSCRQWFFFWELRPRSTRHVTFSF